MRLILTGATGLVGSAVLRRALKDESIRRVTVLTRRPTGVSHPRLKEILMEDFLDYSAAMADFQDANACIWALGISQTSSTLQRYIEITHDYTIAAAKAMWAANRDIRFCFVSGLSANQDERALTRFGKIKGRTERDLSELNNEVYHFRPGYIRPSHRGAKIRTADKIFMPVSRWLDHVTDKFSVSSNQLSRCLIGVAKKGHTEKILDNQMIRSWGTDHEWRRADDL